jgi:NTP pyrophosphatase (non-canonical NTP hydrolase)
VIDTGTFKSIQARQPMSSSDLDSLTQRLREFADARDWEQFHSPKNLTMALSVEVAEIVEHFQWLTEEQSNNMPEQTLDKVETELADTLLYLVRLADKLDIDLLDSARRKIEINEQKYPVEKARGNARKYTDLD